MKAFVKVNNGCFPNVNFYLAWEAFNQMGYSVTCFEEKDYDLDGPLEYDTLEDGTTYACINSKVDLASSYKPNRVHQITVDTPVFSGTGTFRKIIDKLGINYPPFDCYPEVLKPYYGRTLSKSTVGEEKAKFHKDGKPVFVKPVKPKVFIGAVWESLLNLIPLAAVPDDTECYVCEPINILSEYRVYVHDGDILGVKHYYGDWSIIPDKKFVEEVVKNYKPSPIAYGIDIGVTIAYDSYNTEFGKQKYYKPFVIEVNDACNLGNYGLDSIHYGEMLVARWLEIVATPRVDGRIDENLKMAESFTHVKDAKEIYKDMYFKKYDNGFCYRDSLIKNEMEDLRVKSMKAFAEESLRTLKESEKPPINTKQYTDQQIEDYMNDTISKRRSGSITLPKDY